MKLPHLRISFLRAMQAELDANQHKGDWSAVRFDLVSAKSLLKEHVHKLDQALLFGDAAKIREHAADVANIVMKIDELFGTPAAENVDDGARMLPFVPQIPRR